MFVSWRFRDQRLIFGWFWFLVEWFSFFSWFLLNLVLVFEVPKIPLKTRRCRKTWWVHQGTYDVSLIVYLGPNAPILSIFFSFHAHYIALIDPTNMLCPVHANCTNPVNLIMIFFSNFFSFCSRFSLFCVCKPAFSACLAFLRSMHPLLTIHSCMHSFIHSFTDWVGPQCTASVWSAISATVLFVVYLPFSLRQNLKRVGPVAVPEAFYRFQIVVREIWSIKQL